MRLRSHRCADPVCAFRSSRSAAGDESTADWYSYIPVPVLRTYPTSMLFGRGCASSDISKGKNIWLEHRYAKWDRDRVSTFPSELARLKVDVLVTGHHNGCQAGHQHDSNRCGRRCGALGRSRTHPASSRYGGNITASTRISLDLGGKLIALIKETVPKIVRVALLFSGGTVVVDSVEFRETIIVARQLGVKVQILGVSDAREFPGAYAAMVKESADAVIMSFTTNN